MNNTQLSDHNGFDYSRMIFSKPESKQIPNDNPSAPKMTYKTIGISVRNPDGTRGDLVFETAPDLFSFGVSPNTEMGSDRVNGYTVPLCLHNKEGVTSTELSFTDTFNGIIEHIKKHVLSVKDDIEKYDLEESDLKRLNPLYYKRVQGKVVDGVGPTLYAKVLYKKGKGGEPGRIATEFVNVDTNEPIDPTTLEKKYCFVTGAIKFESIYIGTKISVQIKLTEALVRLIDSGPKRLLSRPVSNPTVTATSSVSDALNNGDGDESDSDDSDQDDASDGSLDESDNEDSPDPVPEPDPEPKKTVKRVVRKKAN